MNKVDVVEYSENDFPLADDGKKNFFFVMKSFFNLETIPNALDKSMKLPKLPQPLPRIELEDLEEKARLIAQILELQNTLEGLL